MHPTKLTGLLVSSALGFGFGCAREDHGIQIVDHGACDVLIECAASIAPESRDALLAAYGPDGQCWQGSAGQAQACSDSCMDSLEVLNTAAMASGDPVCGTCTSAADCVEFGPGERCEDGLCKTTGGGPDTNVTPYIDCQGIPSASVNGMFSHTLDVVYGSDAYSDWSAEGLPSGLALDPQTGLLSGTPDSPGSHEVLISVYDLGTGHSITGYCPMVVEAEFGHGLLALHPPCFDFSMSAEELEAALGGDGTPITCRFDEDGSATCPHGDGNGQIPPGISFDESTCTHAGAIASSRYGTWVWLVELEQSGKVIQAPFCAVNDVTTFHDINLLVDGAPADSLQPAIYDFAPDQDLGFGSGSHHWDIDSPECPGSECNNFGFRFAPTCSPFDVAPPWGITLGPSAGTSTGISHEMTASGPAPGEAFRNRLFVTSFEMSYCTSSSGSTCVVDDVPTFEANAQTRYHFAVIGRPLQ